MSYLASADRYDTMDYRRTGRSGLKLPAISLGLWHNFGNTRAYGASREIVLRAFDLGITHFDLANNYGPPPGSAEENFGKMLKQDLMLYRDELVISSKAGYYMWSGPYGE
jgi:L-glyceraldehyde 3-phosphate reductase